MLQTMWLTRLPPVRAAFCALVLVSSCGDEDSTAPSHSGGVAGGCPEGTAPTPGGKACDPLTGPKTCVDGFRAAADGMGCDPILPLAECTAGTMPQLGAEACQPVGWLQCPAGFETHPSGWGCLDVQP